MCRGTVIGSVPLHSTTVRSPNGKRTVRVVAPKRDGTRRPASHATCLLGHDAADRSPRAAARPDPARRVGDDDLVERALDLLGGQPGRQVAGHVVEAERRQHGRLGLDLVVHEPDELLLAGRVEVVRADTGSGPHRRETDLEKRPGQRHDDVGAVERLAQRRLVARVGDAHLLSGHGELLQRLAPPADEPYLEPGPARLGEDEPPGEAGDAEERDRHRASVGCAA